MGKRERYADGQFCWVDLVAHDMDAAETFYRELFGWTAQRQDTQGGPPYTQFFHDGLTVAGLGPMSDEMKSQGVPPMWNSYVNVADIEEAAKKVAELGGTVLMGPMPVMEAGSMAFLQDPGGAAFAIWQAKEHIGAQWVNHPGGCCWNELATRDLGQAKTFYGELFGWTFEDNDQSPAPYVMIHNGSERNGGLMQMDEQWGQMPPHWAVYFTVEDVDSAAEKLQSLGGTVHRDPWELPVGRMAVVADAQGAAFYLIQLNEIDD